MSAERAHYTIRAHDQHGRVPNLLPTVGDSEAEKASILAHGAALIARGCTHVQVSLNRHGQNTAIATYAVGADGRPWAVGEFVSKEPS